MHLAAEVNAEKVRLQNGGVKLAATVPIFLFPKTNSLLERDFSQRPFLSFPSSPSRYSFIQMPHTLYVHDNICTISRVNHINLRMQSAFLCYLLAHGACDLKSPSVSDVERQPRFWRPPAENPKTSLMSSFNELGARMGSNTMTTVRYL